MKGSCLCGKCSFDIKGDPGPVGKCHCTKCRKVSGTGSNAVFWVRPGKFEWLSGEDNTQRYEMPDGWGSIFCRDCGSPLPAFVEDRMWIVPAGLMDEDADVGVRGHIWVENKPHWEIIGDDAPQFMQTPPE
jgi:hypothetical protein